MDNDPAPTSPSASPSRVSPRLILLNLALLAILVVVTITGSRPASAQPTGTPPPGAPTQLPRGRGDYTMVAGKYQGATAAAVYIIDASNQELIALGWDRGAGRLNPIGHRSLVDDAHYLTKPR